MTGSLQPWVVLSGLIWPSCTQVRALLLDGNEITCTGVDKLTKLKWKEMKLINLGTNSHITARNKVGAKGAVTFLGHMQFQAL